MRPLLWRWSPSLGCHMAMMEVGPAIMESLKAGLKAGDMNDTRGT